MPACRFRHLLIGAALFVGAGPAAAQDIQSGIAAWQAGDYAAAVAIWRPLADRGDADAQFNIGQAYRLGRGLPQNLNLAEQWFERAARQRHEQAGASLGLLLFQNGRAREAMPWLQAAAQRGDPRAQYVFGTALFNGDVVRRDLPRAYALMKTAASQGFPQAQAQLAEMESQLSPEDRQRGDALASEMATGGPEIEIAAADPPPPMPETRQPVSPPPAPMPTPTRPGPGVSYDPPPETTRPPQTRPTERPRTGGPGVSYEHPPADGRPTAAPPPAPTPTRPPARTEPPRRPPVERRTESTRPRPAPPAATPRPAQGGWRVQLGAYSNQANAQRYWAQIRRRVSALGGLQPSYQRAGPLTRLRTSPVGNRAAADRVCAQVRSAGGACYPVQ